MGELFPPGPASVGGADRRIVSADTAVHPRRPGPCRSLGGRRRSPVAACAETRLPKSYCSLDGLAHLFSVVALGTLPYWFDDHHAMARARRWCFAELLRAAPWPPALDRSRSSFSSVQQHTLVSASVVFQECACSCVPWCAGCVQRHAAAGREDPHHPQRNQRVRARGQSPPFRRRGVDWNGSGYEA